MYSKIFEGAEQYNVNNLLNVPFEPKCILGFRVIRSRLLRAKVYLSKSPHKWGEIEKWNGGKASRYIWRRPLDLLVFDWAN